MSVRADYKNSVGTLLYSDNSYIYNDQTSSLSSSGNLDSYFSATQRSGTYFIIENLSSWVAKPKLVEIVSIDLIISSSSYPLLNPYGNLVRKGSSYVNGGFYFQEVQNTGSVGVVDDFSRIIFSDVNGMSYNWTSVGTFLGGVRISSYTIPAGDTVQFGASTSVDYTTISGISKTTLSWRKPSTTVASVGTSRSVVPLSPDEQNMRLKNAIDERTRITQGSW